MTVPSNNAIARVILEGSTIEEGLSIKVLVGPTVKPHITVNIDKLTLFPTSLFVDSTADALLKSLDHDLFPEEYMQAKAGKLAQHP